jgi:hypothetical protein
MALARRKIDDFMEKDAKSPAKRTCRVVGGVSGNEREPVAVTEIRLRVVKLAGQVA